MSGRGNHYQRLIKSTLDWIEENGNIPESVQKLVDLTGLSEEQVRSCFPKADALNVALIDHCVVLIADAMRQAMIHADPNNPKDQLQALSLAFFTWGEQNRPLFGILAKALMDPKLASGSMLDMHRQSIRDLVMRKFKECQMLGLIDTKADLNLLLAMAHRGLLGISSMIIYNSIDGWYDGEIRDVGQLSKRLAVMLLDQLIRSPSAMAEQKPQSASA